MKKIIILNNGASEVYSLSEIEYILSEGCYSEFNLTDRRKLTSSKPISYYESILSDYGFIRIHKRYLLNLEHLSVIMPGNPLRVKLKSGELLPVTKYKKLEIYKMFLH